MKYILLLALTITLYSSYGQTFNNYSDKTSFSGEAVIKVPPNQIVLSLGVASRGKDLIITKENNHGIINKAIKFCKKNNISKEYIQTDFINIKPTYNYNNSIEIKYYSVNQSLSIVLSDIKNYEKVLTGLLEIGINQVHDVAFNTTELKKYRQLARKMAIEAAKEKAIFLSENVGVELGKIVNIGEKVSSPMPSYGRYNYNSPSQNQTIVYSLDESEDTNILSLGMISVKAVITLTYELKK